MCGIFGFLGKGMDRILLSQCAREAGRRGPHGYGIAYSFGAEIREMKSTAPLLVEIEKVISVPTPMMVGHARLTTYGSYDDLQDFHPHFSKNHEVAVSHNGNVRNLTELLEEYGIKMRSECDSEVIAHLIELGEGTLLERAAWAISKIDKRSPLAVLAITREGIIIVRRGHPIHVTKRSTGAYFCSREIPMSDLLPDNHAYFYSLNGGTVEEDAVPL